MKASTYEVEAEKLLDSMGIEFSANFLYHGPHFEWEKENRNVWALLLVRGDRTVWRLEVRFGQSINDSFKKLKNYGDIKRPFKLVPARIKAPTAYDLLACLTKYDPGSFPNFCADLGYDEDSRKAEKMYMATQEEWHKVSGFFSAEELEKIREVQ